MPTIVLNGTVRNAGTNALIPGATVRANGQTVTQMWSGQDTPNGASHSVRNMPYNGNLGPNASTNFGFIGTWNGTNSVPATTCSRS